MGEFRDYTNASDAVRENYKLARMNQTLSFVKDMHERFSTYDKKMHIWDILENLNDLVDASDPDTSLPNMYHAVQTAEAIREANLPDWMQLVGLLHDLGKIMYLKGDDKTGTGVKHQWAMVGDTFVVGCRLPNELIYSEYNTENPDMKHPIYSTELGIYEEGCGLANVVCSWGHDEYLYRILKHNRVKIPEEGYYMIRFHSLYTYHDKGAYSKLVSDKDKKMLPWLKLFNTYDLYSKSDKKYDMIEIKKYYMEIVNKYFETPHIWI